jgi:Tfp pilus assembly protein PilZ
MNASKENPAVLEKEIREYLQDISDDQITALLELMETPQKAALHRQLSEAFQKRRRRHVRKPCVLTVIYANQEQSFDGCITNISNSGVFIETQKTVALNEEIMLSFVIPKFQERIRIVGVVVHVGEAGIGVEFKNPLKIIR